MRCPRCRSRSSRRPSGLVIVQHADQQRVPDNADLPLFVSTPGIQRLRSLLQCQVCMWAAGSQHRHSPAPPPPGCSLFSLLVLSLFSRLFLKRLLSSTSRLSFNLSSSMRACILNEVRQEPLDVLFVPQTEQTQLAVGLEPCVLHEVLHAHVLQRPPQLNPYPLDVVGCDASCNASVELKPAEPTFVTNGFVYKTNVAQAGIPLPLIGVDGGTGQDVLGDEPMERLIISVREDEEERLLGPIFPGLGKRRLICLSNSIRERRSSRTSSSSASSTRTISTESGSCSSSESSSVVSGSRR